jgi:radical SAM superfamily enzyme YgiQ (UPF0313 family)
MLNVGIDSTIENNFDIADIEKYDEFTHLGISSMTPHKNQAYNIIHSVKKRFPAKIIIIGGPHANFYLEECLV